MLSELFVAFGVVSCFRGWFLLLELFGAFEVVFCFRSFWSCLMLLELFLAFAVVCCFTVSLLDSTDSHKNFSENGSQNISPALDFGISNAV